MFVYFFSSVPDLCQKSIVPLLRNHLNCFKRSRTRSKKCVNSASLEHMGVFVKRRSILSISLNKQIRN